MRLSKLKKGVIYGGLLAFLLFLLLHSGSSIEAVQGALQLCTKTVIPSLFPFFVLTGLMTGSGLTHSVSQIISPVTKRIFRIEGAESFPFVMGILCGYPTGAKCLMSLYEKNEISASSCRYMLPLCNNAGPLFVIGAVGGLMLGNIRLGVFLYIIHLASVMLMALLFRPKKVLTTVRRRRTKLHETNLLQVFSHAVTDGVFTMANVCGFILFFAVLLTCVQPIFDRFLPYGISLLCQGLIEITNGAYLFIKSPFSCRLMLSGLSFLIGFGGLCVCMQVIAITKGMAVKEYVWGKFLQGIISCLLAYIAYPFCLPPSVQCMAHEAPLAISKHVSISPFITFLPVLVLFLYCAWKTRKNKKNHTLKKDNQV